MMAIGPGKYDALCTEVRERAEAGAVILVVVEGNLGSGFSCQIEAGDLVIDLPGILERIAADIRKGLA